MTYAPASRASCVTIEPTAPAAPCARTLWPARRRPCWKRPCHAARPEIGRRGATAEAAEPREWQAGAHREVAVARERREVARLDGDMLRQRAVAMPVGEAEHSLPYR